MLNATKQCLYYEEDLKVIMNIEKHDELHKQAAAAGRDGDLLLSERFYRDILQDNPLDAVANHNLGVIAISDKRVCEASSLFKAAIDINPYSEHFWSSYIESMIMTGNFEEANRNLEFGKKRGISENLFSELQEKLSSEKGRNPSLEAPSAEDLKSLVDHFNNDRFNDAEVLATSISQSFPRHHLAWQVLGAVFSQSGRMEDALNVHEVALDLIPEDAGALFNVGFSLYKLGRLNEASKKYGEAIKFNPDYIDAHFNLGVTLQEMEKLKDAKSYYKETVRLDPDHIGAHNNLGNVLKDLGEYEEAAKAYRRIIELDPENSQALYNLSLATSEFGSLEEAETTYRAAIKAKPNFALAHNNLAVTLKDLGKFGEAEESYRQAIKFKPDFDQAHFNLADLLGRAGKYEAAQVSFKQSIAINPKYVNAFHNRNFFLNYTTDNSPKEIYQIHMDFEKQFGGLDRRTSLNLPDFMSAKKPLRVGYVSGDLRNHSVAYFLLPILEKHNSEHVEIFCYYNNNVNNQMTDRLRSASDHWRSVYKVSDEDTVELIKNDNIDILVDLSGHSDKNRLLVFAQKPAPIQVTWLGYPNTTGLSAIDYRLTDLVADPVGIADDLHSEELMRLPDGFLCYKGDLTVPPSKVLPSKKNGFTTFGSFNNFSKMSPQVIKVWADILHKVPNSKLILKSSNEVFDEKDYLKLFLEEGISKDRVEIYGRLANYQDHLNLYNLIDICLDTFPYNGATTTCEALWMGVPVIALLGDRHVGRVGASILNSAGLKDFVAEDSDAYIDLATEYAGNEDYLENLRLSLRQKIQSSSLCDADTAARSLETAYKEMWNRYLKESA